jgi:hypothetical protein
VRKPYIRTGPSRKTLVGGNLHGSVPRNDETRDPEDGK